MEQTKNGWTVLDAAHGVLTRDYGFTRGATARTLVARYGDGRLLVVSPPCGLDAAAFADLSEFGTVSAIIANNSFHYLGLPEFSRAFPEAKLYGPAEGLARLKRKQPELGELLPIEELRQEMAGLEPQGSTQVLSVPGFKTGEIWVSVHGAAGPIWYIGDSCFNLPELPPNFFAGLLFKWTKSAPGFRLNGLSKKFFLKDKASYKAWLLERLDGDGPTSIVTAHGDVLTAPSGLQERFRQMVESEL